MAPPLATPITATPARPSTTERREMPLCFGAGVGCAGDASGTGVIAVVTLGGIDKDGGSGVAFPDESGASIAAPYSSDLFSSNVVKDSESVSLPAEGAE